MKTTFSTYFHRQLKKIKDKAVLEDIHTAIINVEITQNIKEIDHLTKLTGYTHCLQNQIA